MERKKGVGSDVEKEELPKVIVYRKMHIIEDFTSLAFGGSEELSLEDEAKMNSLKDTSPICEIPKIPQSLVLTLKSNAYIYTVNDLARFPEQYPGIYNKILADDPKSVLPIFVEQANEIIKIYKLYKD